MLGALVKGSIGPGTRVAGPQGGIRKRDSGPGLLLLFFFFFLVWVISGEFLNLSGLSFPINQMGMIHLLR